jgi:N-acyl-D-aspartate/D-glutamate deacylase
MAMHDLVIRNGTVVDGSGAPARRADVAIDGDRVSIVGTVDAPGRREIDAAGKLVTPGFVDIHTHYDGQATWDPEMTPSSWHGVTTIVMGNCGVGFAPADPAKRDWLIQLMEGVEDIPGTALVEGMSWNWETFPQYLDELERMDRVMDVSALVPHGAVRAYVMGDRGGQNAEATPDEIEAMAKVVREAVEAGAVGFSTTRTILHRAKDGELAAGTTASADELIGIGMALGEAGAGVFELASDMFDPEGEFAWMATIARETGRPVTFNCLQDDVRPEHWRTLIELADEATADGARIVPQVAGRPASVLFGWTRRPTRSSSTPPGTPSRTCRPQNGWSACATPRCARRCSTRRSRSVGSPRSSPRRSTSCSRSATRPTTSPRPTAASRRSPSARAAPRRRSPTT